LVCARSGNLLRADELLARGLELDPGRPDLLGTRAMVLWQLGRAREAQALGRRAADLAPGNADVLNQLAWMLAVAPDPANRDPEEAIRLATEADRLASQSNPQYLDTLAAALAAAGHYEDAEQTAQRALEMSAAAPDSFKRGIRERLALYRTGRAYVEP
ncbi:MAG: hypothetical protein KKC51_02180, partial [Verrucomicrobia bacterium]|nr:hypothetical protein [Verrucomicrobiota bacterium]